MQSSGAVAVAVSREQYADKLVLFRTFHHVNSTAFGCIHAQGVGNLVSAVSQRERRSGMSVKKKEEQRYRPKHPFISGGIAGGFEILVTFPFE